MTRRNPIGRLILVVFLFSAIGLSVLSRPFSAAESLATPTPIESGTPATPSLPIVPATTPTVEPTIPVTLRIPKIDVNAHVEYVGLTEEGLMDVPAEWENVAWYEYGFIPGTAGNAVIAGHLDSTTGPAVFAQLQQLSPGDEIFVHGQDGRELTFVVTEVASMTPEEAPLDRIFGASDTPQLNLITCDGSFDQSSQEYDKRLVVFSTLMES